MSVLLVKSRKLVEVVVVDAITTFDGIELLASCAEVETLLKVKSVYLQLH